MIKNLVSEIFLEHDGEGLLTEAVIDFAFDSFTSTNCANEVVPIQQTFGLHYVMNVSVRAFLLEEIVNI